MEFEGSLARNAPFGASNFQGERSFSRFAWQAQDFGSSLLEKLEKSRTKCSFWKLVAGKVAEASHEMLVLEACCLKSCGSLARNARFGSFCSTGVVLCTGVVLEGRRSRGQSSAS